MTKDQMMPKYEAGERTCPICGEPLPAHQTWIGAKFRFCGKPECVAVVKAKPRARYIGATERRCDGEGCENFVPEGRYATRPPYLSCSSECWYRRFLKGNLVRQCGCGCGREVLRPCDRKTATGLVFASSKHQRSYLINKYLTDHCGKFRDTVDEYLNGFATLHYRDPKSVRSSLGRFFLFLVEERIVSLQDVTPQTITKFLVEVQKSNRGMATPTISNISTFFNWMIGEGRRKAANPVVGMIHYNRKKQRLPRPYEENELNFIWQLLRERGNSRVRLAAAIAEEAGLRIGEICRLRISDVDMVQQRIAVGLPNKSNRERAGFFSHKTSQYCDEWMRERNPDCGHDFLIYNFYGNPYSPTTLAEALKRVLCKTLRGKRIHETGLDKWSMHRLRHNMATNLVSGGADAATVMAAGGWLDPNSMAGYAKVNEPVTRRGYDEAMRRVQYQKQSVPRTIVLTPAELLMRRQVTSVKAELSEVNKRCV